MYKPDIIKDKLVGLIGWRQSYTGAAAIAGSLTASESKRYFQDFHSLLTLENVKSVAPKDLDKVYPTWSAVTNYAVGDFVTLTGVAYKALRANLNKSPEANPSDWEAYSAFSTWLELKTKASILNAIQTFWSEKMAEKTAKNTIETKVLFNGAGSIDDLITDVTKIVGFEIVPIRAAGVSVKIDKIGLQFVQVGTVKLFLMHSSQVDPVKTFDLVVTKAGSMQWFEVADLYLPYVGPDTDAGGSWFLAYQQTAGMTAINRGIDMSNTPYGGRTRTDGYIGVNTLSPYLEVYPFETLNVSAPSDLELWDISKNTYPDNSNYGMNLQLTVECDVTDIIIENRRSLQDVIGLQVACDMLREFAYNPNYNVNRATQNFSRLEILYELDGDSQGYKKSGLAYKLKIAMDAVKIDFTAMSRVCFPCRNNGIKYRTV